MSSLFALLQSQQTRLQTRKGLILLGLQNDFVSPDGKLPVRDTEYLDRIVRLVPAFREYGDIIWVRTEYESNRAVNDVDTTGENVIVGTSPSAQQPESLHSKRSPSQSKRLKVPQQVTSLSDHDSLADTQKSTPRSRSKSPGPQAGDDDEELFLTRTSSREPCCIRGSYGAEYADRFKSLIDSAKDLQVVKSHYSAFGATSLLLTLRSKLITELFVCGNMTNLSVYATAMDAARYGIKITLIVDCLGWRQKDRHELALRQLRQIMSAGIMSSGRVVDQLRDHPQDDEYSDEDESDDQSQSSDVEHESRSDHDAQTNCGVGDRLEVDSDESDREFVPLPVRPRRRLDNTTELPFRRADGSAAGPRASPSKDAQLAGPQGRCRRLSNEQPTSRSFHESSHQIIKRHSDATSSAGHLKGLESPELIRKQQMPWLQLLGPEQSSRSATTSDATNSVTHRGLAGLAALANLSGSTVNEYEAMMKQARAQQDPSVGVCGNIRPLFGEGHEYDSGNSRILYDLLPQDLAETVFDKLHSEIDWLPMHHQSGQVPRLVCCQGTIGKDGTMPVYRHPSDEILPLHAWTPTVELVRRAAEKEVGHTLNHALIQLYRSGDDLITEHSDKTLDIASNTYIANASFGAQRTMRLRTKRSAAKPDAQRTTYRVPMPHNSMIAMSLETNARFLHGINADKRPRCELVDAEKACNGQRISLTFRNIATFLDSNSKMIWGQGAVGNTKETAKPVVNGSVEESDRLIRAFGAENQASTIIWEDIYGEGFDVLHLRQKEVKETI